MKLGVLGGTFDPVHLGHLRIAVEVAEDAGLDQVWLIPAARPPHKEGHRVTPFRHRMEMIRLALRGAPRLGVSDLEGKRGGVSYTVETLKELHHMYPEDLELHFIAGTDAFMEIRTWKDYPRLFEYAHFILVRRPSVRAEDLEKALEDLDRRVERIGDGEYRMPSSGCRVMEKEATYMDISSTRIRQAAAAGRSIRYLVPDRVHDYINQEGLYRQNEEP
ncbi:MAG: nicotinate-nucleotide adenylyltransferase [Desulfobacteraceae bacterium]